MKRDLQEILSYLLKNMESKHILIALIVISLIYFSYKAYEKYNDTELEKVKRSSRN